MVQPGDLVLVHMDNKPAFFARVEDITSDYKPQWYQVKLLVLQIPLMVITWILRRAYIDGDEFTMGAAGQGRQSGFAGRSGGSGGLQLGGTGGSRQTGAG